MIQLIVENIFITEEEIVIELEISRLLFRFMILLVVLNYY